VKVFQRGIFLLFVILYLSAPYLKAQDTSSFNKQVWVMGLFNWKLSERWGFNEDVSYQRLLTEPHFTRIFTRSQINYLFHGITSLHGGLVMGYTFDPSNGDLFEISPWMGIKVRWLSIGRLNFVHYVRLEERNRLSIGVEDGWGSVFRWRYRLGTDIPLNHPTVTDKTFFGIAAYEYFSNESGDTESIWLPATHRFDVGVGYSPDIRTRFEILTVLLDTHDSDTDDFDFTGAVLFLRWKQNFNWL
jgi:hypothetical protein